MQSWIGTCFWFALLAKYPGARTFQPSHKGLERFACRGVGEGSGGEVGGIMPRRSSAESGFVSVS